MDTPRLRVVEGDITHLTVDAIVNAANPGLLGGGGVDGAIHAAAGPALLDACRRYVAVHGPCAHGDAIVTAAGALPARCVIHAVGPIWRGGRQNEPALLARCYARSLELAAEHDVETIAFPNISTGVYGYPVEAAADIAIATVSGMLTRQALPREVTFCCFNARNAALYRARLGG